MTHYDDAKETFRCEHGKVRGTHTCAICDPHLADAALARLQAERDELQVVVDAGEDGYRDMLALERATLLRRTKEAEAARDEAQRQTAALRAACQAVLGHLDGSTAELDCVAILQAALAGTETP